MAEMQASVRNGRTAKSQRDRATAGSFNRAALLLRAIAQDAPRGASLRDLVTRTGLPRPTIHRVLRLLADSNWIERDDDAQFYLGRDLVGLGLAAMVRHPLQRIADPALARLAEDIDQTIYLTLRVGDDAVCVARHEPQDRIQTLVLQVGTREALGTGAGGMAILAALPEQEAQRIIAANIRRYRQRKGFDEAGFREAYTLAQRRGYALHDGLFREGISGIGVAIRDAARHPLAAISTAFVSEWLNQNEREHCATLLQETAANLSRELLSLAR